MSNLPNFKFTLISNTTTIPTLGQIGDPWSDLGNAGAPWTNSSGKIRNVNTVSVSNTLYRPAKFIPGKRYYLALYFQTVGDVIIELGHATDTQWFYLMEAKASPAPQLLACDFVAYANTYQQIQIRLKRPTGVGIDVTLSALIVQEIDTLQRQISPGNWKSLSKSVNRIMGYWGFIEDLEGSIEIVGDDLQWLRSYLIKEPDKRFDCLVEIERDDMPGHFGKYYRGMIDTLGIIGIGIGTNKEGYTYRALVPFLKEAEWSRFTSALNEPIDMFAKKGIHTLDCIDGRNGERLSASDNGLLPRLAYKFKGYINVGQKFTLAPDDNVYIGFGDIVDENDGFEIFSGVSKSDSIKLPFGKMRNIQGSVQIHYSSDPVGLIVAQAFVSDTGAWVTLPSGTVGAINITEAYLVVGISGYPIRFINTSNNQQATVSINASGSNLTITNAQVEFDINPTGQMPLMHLKAYAARILGDYDNLEVPPFEDSNFASGNPDPGIDNAFKNPPPKYLDTSVVSERALGNYYSGGYENWIQGGSQTSITVVTAPSNILLSRFVDFVDGVGISYTTYSSKGTWRLLINVVAGAGLKIEVVGIIDHQVTVLHEFVTVLGQTSYDFSAFKYYEAFGLRVMVAGALTIDSFTFTNISYQRGRYYLTALCNGISFKTNGITTPPPLTSTYKEFNNVLDGLLKIFGLGLEPRINERGQLKLYIDEQRIFFSGNYTAGGVVYAENYEVTMDNDIIRDRIVVGGPAREERQIDQNSSCSKGSYTSTYITTKAKYELTFGINLNSALILNQEVANEDLILVDLETREPSLPVRYRTTAGLTINGTNSPRQLNWLHSEGRIMRRNIDIISGMGSQAFTLTAGVASTRVVVDYPPDFQGPISDADIIFSVPKFTPWLMSFETSMTEDKFTELFFNRFNKIPVDVEGQIRAIYIKTMRHNPATSKAFITGWLVDTGDFSLDFSNDFNNEFIPVLI